MNFLILEDEPLIARRLKKMVEELLPSGEVRITVLHHLKSARQLIEEQSIDLCFLDLNLSGQNGFDLLRKQNTPFSTIITSAYSEKALEAFEFEVIDFVPKPFKKERLSQALDRFLVQRARQKPLSLLVQCRQYEKVIPVTEIAFLKAAGNYSLVECLDGNQYLHSDGIGILSRLLKADFIRIHKSYLVPESQMAELKNFGSGKYRLLLKNKKDLPVSRSIYALLHNRLNGRKT